MGEALTLDLLIFAISGMSDGRPGQAFHTNLIAEPYRNLPTATLSRTLEELVALLRGKYRDKCTIRSSETAETSWIMLYYPLSDRRIQKGQLEKR